MVLKVICLGVARTGTNSVKVALEMLGMKCHHMKEVINSGEEGIQRWGVIMAAKNDQVNMGGDSPLNVTPTQWEEVFEGFDAMTDFPGALFYEDLMRVYPEAKLVLTVRDPGRWYDSIQDSVLAILFDSYLEWSVSVLQMFIPRLRRFIAQIFVPLLSVMVNSFLEYRHDRDIKAVWRSREMMVRIFDQYNERAKIVCGKKLLVMNVKEGWKPLYEHLGCEIPDTPFPQVNSKAEFQKKWKMVKFLATSVVVVLVSAILGILSFLISCIS